MRIQKLAQQILSIAVAAALVMPSAVGSYPSATAQDPPPALDLYRTTVVHDVWDLARLKEIGVQIMRQDEGSAVVLADEDQLEALAHLHFEPQNIDRVEALVAASRVRQDTETQLLHAPPPQRLMRSNTSLGTADSFQFPLDSFWIIQDYDVHPSWWSGFSECFQTEYKNLWHAAQDLAASAGTAVHAVANGTVDWYNPSYFTYPGRVVILRHDLPDGSTIYSMYGHLESVSVQQGQAVNKGDTLGTVLDQGSNSHLHWEMRYFADASFLCGFREGPGYTPDHPDSYRYTNPTNYVNNHQGGNAPTLSFTVRLQGVANPNNQSSEVTVALFRPGTTNIVWGPSKVTTNDSGSYSGLSFQGLPSGRYQICVKPRYHLALCTERLLAPNTTIQVDFGTAFVGDVNVQGEDNVVNSLDADIVVAEMRSCGLPCPNHRFDFNRDGVLNLNDYSLLIYTWGHQPQGEGGFGNSAYSAFAINAPKPVSSEPSATPPARGSSSSAYGAFMVNGMANDLPVGASFNASLSLWTQNTTLWGADVWVRYDTGLLEVVDQDSSTPGVQVNIRNLFRNIAINTVDTAKGLIHISVYNNKDDPPVSGTNLTLADWQFRVLAATGGHSTYVFARFSLGATTDSNQAEDGTGLDVLNDSGPLIAQFTGSPTRPMPIVTVRPTSDSLLNSFLIPITAEVYEPYNQVDRVSFSAFYDGAWHSIGTDSDGSDGWTVNWDTSSVTDQVIKIEATAWLPGELRASAENDFIILDRTPPVYNGFTFSPSPPLCGVGTYVHVNTYDEMTGATAELWVNKAPDGSDSDQWIFIGSHGQFSVPECRNTIFWNTSSFTPGIHRLIFVLKDDAGNIRIVDKENNSQPITATIVRWLPDVDGDGDVDVVDIMKVSSYWGERVTNCDWGAPSTVDLNNDGTITVDDMQIAASFWRNRCSR